MPAQYLQVAKHTRHFACMFACLFDYGFYKISLLPGNVKEQETLEFEVLDFTGEIGTITLTAEGSKMGERVR